MPVFAIPLSSFLCAYLLGSLSFAIIISRLMGLHDPRSYGSSNPGATNVLRSGNKIAAVLTLLLDMIKGWLPVFLLAHWQLGAAAVAAAGLGAFLGHLYPVFFRFHGGKGVATAAGVLWGFSPLLGLLVSLVWLFAAAFFRYSSLAALLAATAAAPLYWFGGHKGWWPQHGSVLLACSTMTVLLIWRHKQNIKRLLARQETRLGKKR